MVKAASGVKAVVKKLVSAKQSTAEETPPAAKPEKQRKRKEAGEAQEQPTKKKKKAVPAEQQPLVTAEPSSVGEAKVTKKVAKKKASAEPQTDAAAVVVAAASKPSAPLPITAGTGPLDGMQVARAVRALLTHVKRERGGLLDEEPPIHVLMSTKQMPKAVGKAKADKAVPLPLPHPFVSLDDAEICLITKDPQREFKDKLAALGLRAKVIGVSKLKKKYHPYEAKRELMKAYGVFLADARVLPMLPPLLGKAFFEKKRMPTPVDLTKKDIRKEIERAACGCTYRHAAGTSTSFQVGTAAQTEGHLVENVIAAVEQVVQRTPGKWTNLQSLNLRTTNSVALPFYNSLPHAN
eukprot:CAMPEP_0174694222 /NCGR_PEP_ID=MMETSP1094-20130205/832_1 /TAXON_ID=156173 /ORGANISM="Chrysochromulina brevifilum, Strain UTEX LB 985" /LENGTH=350 /DNA_ID=CAMNT_0015890379 /DNA_START=24 /DNA_END=1076 /DNA_ORIENTATION=-